MPYGNSKRDGIKVFQIQEFAISIVLLGIMLVFNFQNKILGASVTIEGCLIDYLYHEFVQASLYC